LDKEYFDITVGGTFPEMLEFTKNNFGVKTLLFDQTPRELQSKEKYDVVFALSFFAHINHKNFGKWLKILYDITAPDGYLIFTAQGETSNNVMANVKLKDGFSFKPHDGAINMPMGDKGVTFSVYEYVERICKEYLNCKPTAFREAYWWQHQDLYILRKPSQ
jgi:hypothetical protein